MGNLIETHLLLCIPVGRIQGHVSQKTQGPVRTLQITLVIVAIAGIFAPFHVKILDCLLGIL